MPPESSCGWRFANALSWTISSSSATRCWRTAFGTFRRRSGSSTLRSTFSHGNSAASWNMNDGSPSHSTVPDVGRSRSATRLSSVDLPQPDAPSRHTNSPRPTDSEMSSRAVTESPPLPNTLVTWSIRTATPRAVADPGGGVVAADCGGAAGVWIPITGP